MDKAFKQKEPSLNRKDEDFKHIPKKIREFNQREQMQRKRRLTKLRGKR